MNEQHMEGGGKHAGLAAVKFRLDGGGGGGEAAFPSGTVLGAAAASIAPQLQNGGGYFEGGGRPAELFARGLDFIRAQGRAMHASAALLVGRAIADDCFAGDHHRAVGGLGLLQAGGDVVGLVAVAGQGHPARGFETLGLIGRVRHRNLAVDGDAVVIPQHDEVFQL